jgi:hypothetical protein
MTGSTILTYITTLTGNRILTGNTILKCDMTLTGNTIITGIRY